MSKAKTSRLDSFFSGPSGKRFFNYTYSWGASIVIIGAMFKILHLPYGSWILGLGMVVEALVFFISGFDNPALREESIEDETMRAHASVTVQNQTPFSPEQAKKMSEAVQNIDDFSKTMCSLNEVSLSLLSSYNHLTSTTEGVTSSSMGFADNLKGLNNNVTRLNAIYEAQLQSISDQIATVKYINESLDRIKNLFDGTVADSSAFRQETEKMTKQIEALNQVYARLLNAMTANNPLNS